MKASKLKYLSLLGFLGLLGIPTGNPGFYGFFGFLGFWGLARQKSDELLALNAARAGLNAFVVSLVGVSATIAVVSIFETLEAAALSIAAIFIAQLLTFIICLNYYEKRGDR